jgi:hypothetical protein
MRYKTVAEKLMDLVFHNASHDIGLVNVQRHKRKKCKQFHACLRPSGLTHSLSTNDSLVAQYLRQTALPDREGMCLNNSMSSFLLLTPMRVSIDEHKLFLSEAVAY